MVIQTQTASHLLHGAKVRGLMKAEDSVNGVGGGRCVQPELQQQGTGLCFDVDGAGCSANVNDALELVWKWDGAGNGHVRVGKGREVMP